MVEVTIVDLVHYLVVETGFKDVIGGFVKIREECGMGVIWSVLLELR